MHLQPLNSISKHAKTALKEKRGSEALQLAYQAVADAKLARKSAINIAKNSELNAAILQKEAKAELLRQRLSDKESELRRTQSEMLEVRGEGNTIETESSRP